MSKKPNHRIRQIHLSTLILLTIASGILMFKGFHERECRLIPEGDGVGVIEPFWIDYNAERGFRVQGWPFDCYWSSHVEARSPTLSKQMLALDICIAVIILGSILIVTECYAGFNEMRKFVR